MDTAASILVIDDDLDIRQALAEVLADGPAQVATARDGYDGLEKLDALGRPCLILLDMMMPRMSGLDFLEHLSRRPALGDIRIIVMSANDSLRRQAERHPAVHATLRKPFDFDGLLSLVNAPVASTTGAAESRAAQ